MGCSYVAGFSFPALGYTVWGIAHLQPTFATTALRDNLEIQWAQGDTLAVGTPAASGMGGVAFGLGHGAGAKQKRWRICFRAI